MRLHQPSSQGVYSPGVPGDGNGDVVGPVASTDGAIALWDGTGGNTLKNSNLVYSVATLSVPDGFTVSSAGSIALTAGGTNKSITLTPSGTGGVSLLGNNGVAGGGVNDTIALTVGSPAVSAGTNAYGVYGASTAPAGVTGTFSQFYSNPRTAASLAVTALTHFRTTSTTLGSGSTIATQEGFTVTTTMTQGTVNYGFRGLLAASGVARYNLYMDGTAPNYLAGVTGIGIAPSSTAALALAASTTGVASLRIPSGTAPSSPISGDFWYNGTNLIFRDGSTTRTLSWT